MVFYVKYFLQIVLLNSLPQEISTALHDHVTGGLLSTTKLWKK